jgi:hypothetical protein
MAFPHATFALGSAELTTIPSRVWVATFGGGVLWPKMVSFERQKTPENAKRRQEKTQKFWRLLAFSGVLLFRHSSRVG